MFFLNHINYLCVKFNYNCFILFKCTYFILVVKKKMTNLWVNLRKKEAILRHYERQNVYSKDRIFAEADFLRAVIDVYNESFKNACSFSC